MIPQPEGDKWRVGDQLFDTNAQAWRWIDRQENQPVSRAENVSDWIAGKILKRE